jgi:serine/threonine-protein kinase
MANSPARSVIDVGSVVAETYTIEALIGRGGMGSVFLARHNRLPGKRVAIKLLHVEITDEDVIARFRREAFIASELDHPNIVRVDDYNFMSDGTPYLVLEFLQGESLASLIKRGPIPLDRAISIIRQVGSAVAAAHRAGVVHRDLKPQNIFLVPTEVDGRAIEVAKVLDFGISKIRGSTTVKTQDYALLGTPQYMAPEQAKGEHGTIDERTDVFALGAIVYEMLSGRPSFTGASIPEVVFKVVYEEPAPLGEQAPALPAEVVAAVARAMAKNTDDRFASVSAFVEALTGQPLPPLRTGSMPAPDVGFATGSENRSTGQEAFAQTMDSGSGVAGQARVSPESVQPRSIPPIAKAETVLSDPGITPPPVERPQRPVALIAALAFAVLACAGLAIYLVTRGKTAPTAPVAVVPDAAVVATAVDAAAPVVAIDAGVVVAIAPDAGAAPRPPRPPQPPRPPVDDPSRETPDTADDPDVRDMLERAQAALDAGKLGDAERFSNNVLNREKLGPRPRSRAHAIHGVVMCKKHNSEEGAMTDLRNIRIPKFRKMLLDACHDSGWLKAIAR